MPRWVTLAARVRDSDPWTIPLSPTHPTDMCIKALGSLASWALGSIATRWLPNNADEGEPRSLALWGVGIIGFDRGALPLGLNMVQVMRRVSTCCGCNLKVVCSSQRVLGQLQIATTCPHRRYTALQCEPRKSGGGAFLIRFGVDGRRVASVGSSDLDVYFGPRRSCLLVSFSLSTRAMGRDRRCLGLVL